MWSLYKSETLTEFVGYMSKQAEVPVLKLCNLARPLNTLPHEGHFNTFDSGDPMYFAEMSTGYQSAGMPFFFQIW